jgi:predicted dehydrogenase
LSGAKLSIAVVGLGRAGRARVRALEAHPRAELVAVVRREPVPGERHLFEIVEDAAVDAVLVCTPNRLHEEVARACLEAGKHVAVEFPLAETAAAARDLLQLAARVGRVLHVEHIELLSSSQKAQRARAAGLGRPTGGELRFSGDDGGWIGDPALAGSAALRAVARLHRLVDLFGEVDSLDGRLEGRAPTGYRLAVGLAFRDGGGARLIEDRGPGLRRHLDWAIECESGLLDNPPAAPAGQLFLQDLDWFLDRIERGAEPYVSDRRVLHVLELVDRIDELTAQGAGA